MPTLVIKSFPEDLHSKLKQKAAEHRRSVTQETIYLIEKALSGDRSDPNRAAVSYWTNRTLVPEFEDALKDGAFAEGTESTQAISDERDER